MFFGREKHIVNSEVVLVAVEVWLLWIQPWSAEASMHSHRGLLTARHIPYSEAWKPYVALNLNFYSTLLACFFK